MKGRTIFGRRMLFELVSGGFSYLINKNKVQIGKNNLDLETCRKS
jgi:hypothetical protein